jgi:fibrillarin-like rRNA methylase
MSSLKGGWMEMTDSTGVTSLAFVSEIVREGETAPLEYCTPQIKDMIISARKQNLITSLEQDLLKDAREKGQFVIY